LPATEPTDLDLLVEAAEAAGEIATRLAGTGMAHWEKPGGAGPVTEADMAVNAMLAEALRGRRPEYGWLSEETEDDPDRLLRERVFGDDVRRAADCGNRDRGNATTPSSAGWSATASAKVSRTSQSIRARGQARRRVASAGTVRATSPSALGRIRRMR